MKHNMNPIPMMINTTVVLFLSIGIVVAEINIDIIVLSGLKKKIKIDKQN